MARSASLPAAPKLAVLMRTDPVDKVRGVAAVALAEIGSQDPGVVKALKEALRGPDIWVWAGAARALGQVRPRDQESLDLLTKIRNADPYKLGRNNLEWAAVMSASNVARKALLNR